MLWSVGRDQKAIDIENRANYVALKQRWAVLDVSIQIPDDEMVKSIPSYMEEDSENEEEESSSPPDHTLGNAQIQQATDCCPVLNGGLNPQASKESIHQRYSDDTDNMPSSTGFPNPHRDKRSVGETTDLFSSSTQCACRMDATSGSSGRVRPLQQQCELSYKPLCQHFKERIAPASFFQDNGAEMKPKCRCNFRRKSASDILDEDGMALFNILEFPSKVRLG